ncbi:PREDICTED: slit homolog 3 protein [Papilio polytes]|uniref:slit homolog 3 protein n=1 Tax=Papilio polytes TaxID=76194 RepID=UPI000675C52F|nr:PREDICTED: slit homolog 3 protein [Papilio polytes]
MGIKSGTVFLWLTLGLTCLSEVFAVCPPPDTILPCICTNRNEDVQIWCTHSDLQQVLKGVQKIGEFVRKPIDELIIENNYLPSLPGKIFQNVIIQRLMLRHNGIERMSATWLETQEMNLVEIFIVENELKSIPAESLAKLQHAQAITIHSDSLRRIPPFVNNPKLKYISIETESLTSITKQTFANLPNLERLFIRGSGNLHIIEENAFYNLPALKTLEITDCGITHMHMRAFSLLPNLKQLSLSNNEIFDATMVGRAIRDLPMLTLLNLNYNLIDKLNEGAFVDQTMLETLYLSHNNINIIHHGAFHRVPKLRIVDLNFNNIIRIHPESFLQQSSSGVEELSLIGNKIMHISEFRALLDALPRLRFLDMSDNLLEEIPRGALRGHPSLERLHLNSNSIKFIEGEAFVAMPALRELHLSKNSLGDLNEGPFWNLPSLKGLDLSHNYFQRLQPKLLYNLPSLRRINISNNKLTVIDPLTFIETPLLEYVNVSGNELVSIHPATFRNLASLYELDASSNKLIEFIPGLPRGLEQLNVERNQITSLPVHPSPDLDLPSLRTLDISSNGIQRIATGTFKTLHNLRRLYMKRNGLRQIDITTFSDVTRLEVLDLSYNQIISIHLKSFTKLLSLKQINLHGNNIDNFDFMILKDNNKLSTLDFSKNKLKSINPKIAEKTLEIEVLNISSNNLYELPTSLNVFEKLIILDSSFNHIKFFDGNIISNLQMIKEIKLPYNKIIEVRSGSFRDLKHLETIDMDSNKIEIIHSMAIANLPNVLSIYLSRNHIIDIPDRVFSNLPKLRIIELQGNRLQFISARAFENTPLVQYLNVSNNQLTNLESSGIRQLFSLEVLDLSFNKLTKITTESFQYMEWLVELTLDNNKICHISGQPFNSMPRLKVLSLRYNKLTNVAETNFEKLRNNIAILDIDGNPLICNCAAMWLKSWLLESTSIGPKCADGTYVKGMPFSRNDCLNSPIRNDNLRDCITHENEALLPNLATSQVFSSSDKINGYITQEKNNLQANKINTRPTPEESDYFYDDYVDYPFNETVMDVISNQNNFTQTNEKTQDGILSPSKLNTNIKNMSTLNPVTPSNAPRSGFTFFGMPLPSIDMSKFLNTGRKIDWFEKRKQPQMTKYQSPVLETPKFETGGFTPMLPTTDGGFMPIPSPTMPVADTTQGTIAKMEYTTYQNTETEKKNVATEFLPPRAPNRNNIVNTKSKSEIYEVFSKNNNATQISYNLTKNMEERKSSPSVLNQYHSMESNLTIEQVTEKESIITTDTSNDLSIQAWMESTTSIPYPAPMPAVKPPMKKHINEPTALSAVLIPSNEELERREYKRPATITKVNLPHLEHPVSNYTLINNREPKTRFPQTQTNTRTKNEDDKDWYYKNYNKSNLEPYIAPGIHTSYGHILEHKKSTIYCLTLCYFIMFIDLL